jgi:DNA mismatch repair protein MutS2
MSSTQQAPDQNTIEVLEMDRLLIWVAEFAATNEATDLIVNTSYSLSARDLKTEFNLVAEMRDINDHRRGFHFSQLSESINAIRKLLNSPDWLSGHELHEISAMFHLSSDVCSFLDEEEANFPSIHFLCDTLDSLSEEQELLKAKIAEDGELRDTASPELGRLRKSLLSAERRLRKELDKVESDWRKKGVLGDTGLSWRDGRPVLPVNSGARGRVTGLVVDQSQSGQTLFIEPIASLEIRGNINKCRIDLHQEEVRILKMISERLRNKSKAIADNQEILINMDRICAKALWSREANARRPLISDNMQLIIKNGRHPLLERNTKVVPLNLDLSGSDRVLLISGPNAGGKTVAMKTVGLFALMVRAGLPVPCDKGTRLPLFKSVLTDIGDQQSIENDLSTYSSHLTRMKKILENANSQSLYLVDELGGGTDPEEGSAIAIAFLERMLVCKGQTIVSSHLGQLKAFAHDTIGIENASMSFDEENIQPKFSLVQGVPGSSYALEILQRLGLPKILQDRARYHMGSEQKNLARLISDLQSRLAQTEKMRRTVEARQIELESQVSRYNEKLKTSKKEAKIIRQEATSEAAVILKNANSLIEKTVREIKESDADKSRLKDSRNKLEKKKQNLERQAVRLSPKKEAPVTFQIKIGDQVLLEGLETPARVIRVERNGKRLGLEAGVMKMTCDSAKVIQHIPASTSKSKKQNYIRSAVSVSSSDPGLRLDLRGFTADEALAELDRYIDECLVCGLSFATILHGKGTGVLRHVVQDKLRTYHCVTSIRDGQPEEGGSGVTVIKLDV